MQYDLKKQNTAVIDIRCTQTLSLFLLHLKMCTAEKAHFLAQTTFHQVFTVNQTINIHTHTCTAQKVFPLK